MLSPVMCGSMLRRLLLTWILPPVAPARFASVSTQLELHDCVPSLLLYDWTLNVASSVSAAMTWDHACCRPGLNAIGDSTAPTAYSRFQSPPRSALPVASMLALTSAPLR